MAGIPTSRLLLVMLLLAFVCHSARANDDDPDDDDPNADDDPDDDNPGSGGEGGGVPSLGVPWNMTALVHVQASLTPLEVACGAGKCCGTSPLCNGHSTKFFCCNDPQGCHWNVVDMRSWKRWAVDAAGSGGDQCSVTNGTMRLSFPIPAVGVRRLSHDQSGQTPIPTVLWGTVADIAKHCRSDPSSGALLCPADPQMPEESCIHVGMSSMQSQLCLDVSPNDKPLHAAAAWDRELEIRGKRVTSGVRPALVGDTLMLCLAGGCDERFNRVSVPPIWGEVRVNTVHDLNSAIWNNVGTCDKVHSNCELLRLREGPRYNGKSGVCQSNVAFPYLQTCTEANVANGAHALHPAFESPDASGTPGGGTTCSTALNDFSAWPPTARDDAICPYVTELGFSGKTSGGTFRYDVGYTVAFTTSGAGVCVDSCWNSLPTGNCAGYTDHYAGDCTIRAMSNNDCDLAHVSNPRFYNTLTYECGVAGVAATAYISLEDCQNKCRDNTWCLGVHHKTDGASNGLLCILYFPADTLSNSEPGCGVPDQSNAAVTAAAVAAAVDVDGDPVPVTSTTPYGSHSNTSLSGFVWQSARAADSDDGATGYVDADDFAAKGTGVGFCYKKKYVGCDSTNIPNCTVLKNVCDLHFREKWKAFDFANRECPPGSFNAPYDETVQGVDPNPFTSCEDGCTGSDDVKCGHQGCLACQPGFVCAGGAGRCAGVSCCAEAATYCPGVASPLDVWKYDADEMAVPAPRESAKVAVDPGYFAVLARSGGTLAFPYFALSRGSGGNGQYCSAEQRICPAGYFCHGGLIYDCSGTHVANPYSISTWLTSADFDSISWIALPCTLSTAGQKMCTVADLIDMATLLNLTTPNCSCPVSAEVIGLNCGNKGLPAPGCGDGHFRDKGGDGRYLAKCSACAPGSYKVEADATGLAQLASDQPEYCHFCPAAFYSLAAQSECTACVPGTFADDENRTTCTACPVGRQSAQMATACTNCTTGRFNNGSYAGACARCPSGYSQGHPGSTACVACAVGTFASLEGSAVCSQCLSEWQNSTGQSDCKTCTVCGVGKYASNSCDAATDTVCATCAAGQYQTLQGKLSCNACENCAEGKYITTNCSSTTARQCTDCGVGKYSDASNNFVCTTCPHDFFQSLQGKVSCAVCTECDAGQFVQSSLCSTTQDQACLPCSVGRYAAAKNNLTCTECPQGYSQTLNGQSACKACTRCSPGKYVTRSCRAYYLGESFDATCTDCPPGFISSAVDEQSCTICPAGFVQGASGRQQCLSCPPGSVQPGTGNASCLTCQAGTYQSNQTCVNCPTGFLQPSSGKQMCELCRACAQGTFYTSGNCTTTLDDTMCGSCAMGKYADIASSSCVPCLTCGQGKYISSDCTPTQNRVCQNCPGGTVQSSTDQAVCNSCAEGTYQTGINETCGSCPIGYVQPSSSKQLCTPCPGGSVQPGTGNTTCTTCSSGHFQVNQTCASCPTGFLQVSSGKQLCTPCRTCTAGTFHTSGNCTTTFDDTVCGSCESGKYANAGSGSCEPCSSCGQGKYIDSVCTTTQDQACQSCPGGYVQPSTDQIVCDGCPAGKFEHGGSCKDCPRGWSQVQTGSQSCADCRIKNQVQSEVGKVTCSSCTGEQRQPDEKNIGCECKNTWYDMPRSLSSTTSAANDTDGDCTACPVGALCCERMFGPGVLRLKKGFWRPPTFTTRLYACPVADACRGFTVDNCDEVELDNTTTTTQEASSSNGTTDGVDATWVSTCRESHTGPGCALCIDNYKPDADGICIDCSSEAEAGGSTMRMLTPIIGTAALILVRAMYEIRVGYSDAGEIAYTLQADTQETIASPIYVLLPFLQRIGALDVALPDINMPVIPQAIVDMLKMLYANLARLFVTISPCHLHMDFLTNLGIALGVVPWLTAVLLLVYPIVYYSMRHKQGWHAAQTKARLMGSALFGCKLLHPFISQVCLQFMLCTELADDASYLTQDVSIECWRSDAHASILIVSIIGNILWVIGIPIFLLFAVIYDQRRLDQDEAEDSKEDGESISRLFSAQTATNKAALRVSQLKKQHIRMVHEKMHRSVTPFTNGTKKKYYYLFIIDMFISFIFIAFLGILAGDFVELQITLSIITAVVQLVVPAALQPYESKSDNDLAVTGAIAFGTMELAALTKYFAETAVTTSGDVNEADALEGKLETIDNLLSVVMVTGLVCLIGIALPGLLEAFKKIVEKSWKKLRNKAKTKGTKVAPKVVSKSGAQVKQEEADMTAVTAFMDATPTEIHRAPANVLARLPKDRREAYMKAYRDLHDMHTHVMVVSIQAAVRGKSARRTTVGGSGYQATIKAALNTRQARGAPAPSSKTAEPSRSARKAAVVSIQKVKKRLPLSNWTALTPDLVQSMAFGAFQELALRDIFAKVDARGENGSGTMSRKDMDDMAQILFESPALGTGVERQRNESRLTAVLLSLDVNNDNEFDLEEVGKASNAISEFLRSLS